MIIPGMQGTMPTTTGQLFDLSVVIPLRYVSEGCHAMQVTMLRTCALNCSGIGASFPWAGMGFAIIMLTC